MRIFVLCTILFNLSPLPAVAGSLVEGQGGALPSIKVTPVLKNLAPVSLGGLEMKTLEIPGAQIPGLTAIVQPEANVGALNAIDPAVLPAQMQAPQAELAAPKAEEPKVLPGLQAVGEKLDAGESSRGGSIATDQILDHAYDKWADDGGAVRAAVDVEGRATEHSAPLTSPRDSNDQILPQVPQSSPAPVKETPRWYNIFPNMVTTGNLWSGMAGAYFASQGKVVPAVVAIIAANIFDALDGRTARALKVKNPLGIDYDSLADVVSFGIAPALLIFKAALLPALGFWGFPIAALFATAGWFRLSRFNVGAHAEEAGTVPHKTSDSFTGLPIPGGAGVIAAVALTLGSIAAPWAVPFAAGMTLLTAAAMASRLPYPAFKKGGIKALILPAIVGAAAVVPLAVLGLYTFIPAAIFGLYLLTGPLIALWQGGSETWKKELKRKAFHQLLLLSIPAFYLVGAAHAVWVAAAAVGVIGIGELFRLKVPATRPFFERVFGKIMRAKESDRMSGMFYVALGLGTVAAAVGLLHLSPLLFPAAALALALGDAAGPLVGLRFGFKPYKVMGTQRSVDGTAAGFAVALTIGLALGFPWLAALGAAIAFSVVDTLPVKPDDNLWIPIAYAAALALLSLI